MGPDGLVAAAIRNGTIHVRDAATGRGGFDATMEASIYDLAWSPSGDVLAVAAGDATHGWVTVTDRSGRRRATLQAEPGVAFQTVAFTHDGGAATGSVAFSPGGSQLASVGADGLVRIWALDVEDAVAIAEREVTRTLTDAECRQYLHTDRCPRA
jgi:WD40 repeat protein